MMNEEKHLTVCLISSYRFEPPVGNIERAIFLDIILTDAEKFKLPFDEIPSEDHRAS